MAHAEAQVGGRPALVSFAGSVLHGRRRHKEAVGLARQHGRPAVPSDRSSAGACRCPMSRPNCPAIDSEPVDELLRRIGFPVFPAWRATRSERHQGAAQDAARRTVEPLPGCRIEGLGLRIEHVFEGRAGGASAVRPSRAGPHPVRPRPFEQRLRNRPDIGFEAIEDCRAPDCGHRPARGRRRGTAPPRPAGCPRPSRCSQPCAGSCAAWRNTRSSASAAASSSTIKSPIRLFRPRTRDRRPACRFGARAASAAGRRSPARSDGRRRPNRPRRTGGGPRRTPAGPAHEESPGWTAAIAVWAMTRAWLATTMRARRARRCAVLDEAAAVMAAGRVDALAPVVGERVDPGAADPVGEPARQVAGDQRAVARRGQPARHEAEIDRLLAARAGDGDGVVEVEQAEIVLPPLAQYRLARPSRPGPDRGGRARRRSGSAGCA